VTRPPWPGMGAVVMAQESSLKTSYVPNEVRASVVAALLAIRRTQALPTWRVRAAAADLAVSVRTVWRWLEQAEGEGRMVRKVRVQFVVEQEDLVELADHRGNVEAVYRARVATSPDWVRCGGHIARALSPGRQAGIVAGERARRDYDTYLPRPAGRPRNDCWEADHTQLAVHVVLPDGRVVMPWATLFVDQACRVILGWALAVTPSQETVLGALRAAIDIEAPNGPMGGVPVAIRFDRGKEFLANAVGLAAASLAIDARPLRAYSPHLKGTVERTNESTEQLFLATLSGFVHGARGRDGQLVEDGPLLGLEALVELFAAFVIHYNTTRTPPGHRRPRPGAGVGRRCHPVGGGATAASAAPAAGPGRAGGQQTRGPSARAGLQLRRTVRLGR